MNILFVVPYVPNLIRVRPYNLVRNLTELGHKVTVATLYGSDQERQDAEALKAYCFDVKAMPLPRLRSLANAAAALPSSIPLQAVYCWLPAFASELETLALGGNGQGAFDIVHVEHLRGARYGLHIKHLVANGKASPPVVWDSVDCISLLFRQAMVGSRSLLKRMVTRLELGRTEVYEGWLAQQFDQVLVTSSTDKKALASLMPAGSPISAITVVANGVDLDYFKPDLTVKRDPSTLVLTGKMSYHANATMALHLIQDIMPIVWARCPDARVVIAGKDPPREIHALAQNPAITVTGTVEDIRPYLRSATLAVTPITYGAGIQNKVLEAMACATPVVSTPQAVSALHVIPGRDVLVGQEPLAFAQAVLDLIRDPVRAAQVGQAGRVYVETHHKWPEIASQLEGIYLNTVRTPDSSPER